MTYSTTLNLETYSCQLMFIITDQLKKEKNKISKKHTLELIDDGEDEGVFILTDMTKYYLLIDIKYLSHNTIAHEIYHSVVGITEDRGVTDEEAQSWLCGHITGKIYKFIEKKNLQVKHG
jgi:hypothetical protein